MYLKGNYFYLPFFGFLDSKEVLLSNDGFILPGALFVVNFSGFTPGLGLVGLFLLLSFSGESCTNGGVVSSTFIS